VHQAEAVGVPLQGEEGLLGRVRRAGLVEIGAVVGGEPPAPFGQDEAIRRRRQDLVAAHAADRARGRAAALLVD